MKKSTNQVEKIKELKKEIATLKRTIKKNQLLNLKEIVTQNEIANLAIKEKITLHDAKIVFLSSNIIKGYLPDLFRGQSVHPNSSGYSKGWTTKSSDKIAPIAQLLDFHNVQYICGNDAPRKGWGGNFIRLKTSEDFFNDKYNEFYLCLLGIVIDETFEIDMKAIIGKVSTEKNQMQQKAFSGLLSRCNVICDTQIYWPLFMSMVF